MTRRSVRRRGGLVAVAVAGTLWVVSIVVKSLIGGAVGGASSFAIKVVALPFMPVFGIPADTGGNRMTYAVIASIVLWWIIGQTVGARVTKKVVSGWREWSREFLVMSIPISLGAVLAFVLAALMLGAL